MCLLKQFHNQMCLVEEKPNVHFLQHLIYHPITSVCLVVAFPVIFALTLGTKILIALDLIDICAKATENNQTLMRFQ